MKNTTVIPPDEISALLDKAEEHFEKSEYAQAEKLTNNVLTLANGNNTLPRDDEARALCIFGECCYRTARYDEALTHLHNALTTAKAASNLSLQSRALMGTAGVQGDRGDYNTMLGTAEHAFALAEKVGDKKEQGRALNAIGVAHLGLCGYKRALDYLAHALALAEEIGDKLFVASTLGNIGLVHYNQADCPRSLEYYARGLAIAESIGNKECAGKFLVNIGVVSSCLADYSGALDYFARSLAITEEIGDRVGVAVSLGYIGSVYENLDDYPRALDYFSRSLATAEEIGYKNGVVEQLCYLGFTYMDSGNNTLALEYLNRALEFSKQIGDQRNAGNCMIGIAETQSKLGNHDDAYQVFLNSLQHCRNILETNHGVSTTLVGLGSVLIEKGKTKEGLAYLNEALTLAVELGEKKTALSAHKKIANAYSQMGDMANAFEHLKKHLALNKEIFSEESKKSIEKFNMRVAIAEKEIQTEVQKLRAEQFEKENKIQQLELEKREVLLTSQATQLVTQTELLSKFRDEMREIVQKYPSTEPGMKEVKEKLKELPCKQIDWEKFETEFKAVHPEFTRKLAGRSLTPMQMKMCSLLRLNLKSYEIARLFCLTERAVEFHRLNIRKKLGLSKDQNLAQALENL